MNTEIIKVKGDWEEVVNDCRATVGKSELGKEPSEKFKKSILIHFYIITMIKYNDHM